jgi:arylsulfatase A
MAWIRSWMCRFQTARWARLVLFAITATTWFPAACALAEKPNIVYILADDLGYGDLRCLNPESRIPTPNMDRLAAEGLTFTDAHSGSAVCTPTRYGILTGRYAWRTRLQRGVLYGYAPPLIDHGELTVAQFLKDQGYHTACIGKWHLGLGWQTKDGSTLNDDVKLTGEQVDFTKPVTHGPRNLGFDYFFGISASLDMPPYVYIENDRTNAIPTQMKPTTFRVGLTAEGFEPVKVLPDLTSKAIDFIKDHHAKTADQPFFLYFPLTAPHTPVVPAPFVHGLSKAGDYGDFTAQVDHTVGEVLKTLDDLGIAGNTLVVMTSDNGSTMVTADMLQEFGHRPNHTFRGRKSDAWEGGHHVPLLVRWPEKVKPGTSTDEVTCLTDLLATVADIVGVPLPNGAGSDSVSMLPVLLDVPREAPLRKFTVHHSIEGSFALRRGPWKLIDSAGSGGWSSNGPNAPRPQDPPVQLYNLDHDPGEQNNRWESEPEILAELRALLESSKAGN